MKLPTAIIIASLQFFVWWLVFHFLYSSAKATGTDFGLAVACMLAATGCAIGLIIKHIPKE